MDNSALDKACSLWVKRVYRRDGTVPTRPEWLAWRMRWLAQRKHLVPGPWAPQSDCRCQLCRDYFTGDRGTKP